MKKMSKSMKKAASEFGRMGGLAGRGASKARDPQAMSRAGKLGMAKRWGKKAVTVVIGDHETIDFIGQNVGDNCHAK